MIGFWFGIELGRGAADYLRVCFDDDEPDEDPPDEEEEETSLATLADA